MSTKTSTRKKYDKAQLEFLRAGYAKMTVSDLTRAFNRKFGVSKSEASIKSALNNHRIRCGRKYGEHFYQEAYIYTHEQVVFLRKSYAGRSVEDLTRIFNDRFGASKTKRQIRTFVHNRRIKSGRTGQFEKGHVPANKGARGLTKRNRGTFSKGNVPGNVKQIGSERIDTKQGYILIKVEEKNPYTGCPTRFKHKHIHLWEQKHGRVPAGFTVIFKDGNKRNLADENLVSISRAELLHLNQRGYSKTPGELKPSVLALARMDAKMFELLKKKGR